MGWNVGWSKYRHASCGVENAATPQSAEVFFRIDYKRHAAEGASPSKCRIIEYSVPSPSPGGRKCWGSVLAKLFEW